ncbi:MAG: sigma-70 family RNA polymerase sigma factor [Prochlorotrichaceae cyanobacterium]
MQIPKFPEAEHPLIQALARYSDRDLLILFQRHPDQGRYFTAIFCRYSPIVYTLIWHSLRSQVQGEYLFAQTWRHIYYELGGLDLRSLSGTGFNLQNWLINITAHCINVANLPPVESIQYSLAAAPPVLWCYLDQALDRLPPLLRLMVIMAQTFRWSDTRIAAYLRAEGEKIPAAKVAEHLKTAYEQLEVEIPEDVRLLYCDANPHSVLSFGTPNLVAV